MSNEQLYKNALEAINKLFADTSISKEAAIENLEGLKDEIDVMIDSLRG
jgi:hypothetical protein